MNYLWSSLLTKQTLGFYPVEQADSVLCSLACVLIGCEPEHRWLGAMPPVGRARVCKAPCSHCSLKEWLLPPKWRSWTGLLHSKVNWNFVRRGLKSKFTYVWKWNGHIKCILWKKCLGFDQMHCGIIMWMFSVDKSWAEIDSAIQWAEEKSGLCSAPGVGKDIAVCYLFSRQNPRGRCLRIGLFPLKLRFLWVCTSRPVHADTRAHVHTHLRCGFSVWVVGGIRTGSVQSFTWPLRDAGSLWFSLWKWFPG